ncbi:MAG: hypothetical protein IKJ32_03745 [Clostridia bacterium]|nr:hypothetical protein [Clostridia bacterium]
MKTDKEINEIIKQGLEEYAKAETKSEDTADVTFSKTHEEKMQKMFDNMRKENKSSKTADRELVIHIKFNWFTKVAVAVIVVGVFVSAVSTGIKAWRESKLNSYEGSGDYSWLLPNDTSEMYEKKTDEEAIDYVKKIFPGLTGEVSEVVINGNSKIQRINFKYNNKETAFKFGKNMNIGLDDNNSVVEKIYFKGDEITKYIGKNFVLYTWNHEEASFSIYREDEDLDIKEFIESINYEKIETNF